MKSIAFKGVGPGGADIYALAFDNHAMEWRIFLSADGKTEALGLTAAP